MRLDGHDDPRAVYLVFPEAWKKDMCAGFDSVAVAKLMHERGILLPGTGGKLQSLHRPPGENTARFYALDFDAEGWNL
jgi:putative DNA primase/helicase